MVAVNNFMFGISRFAGEFYHLTHSIDAEAKAARETPDSQQAALLAIYEGLYSVYAEASQSVLSELDSLHIAGDAATVDRYIEEALSKLRGIIKVEIKPVITWDKIVRNAANLPAMPTAKYIELSDGDNMINEYNNKYRLLSLNYCSHTFHPSDIAWTIPYIAACIVKLIEARGKAYGVNVFIEPKIIPIPTQVIPIPAPDAASTAENLLSETIKVYSGTFKREKILPNADHARFTEYINHLVKENALPPEIKPINTCTLPKGHIKRSIHKLWKEYNLDRVVCVDFLLAVFPEMFKEVDKPELIRARLNDKVNNYDDDIRHILQSVS